ncbi:hypothetical protein R3P38DRAFT_3228654 [Favolaschia claudopus]|uniref:Cytochrome P450 n=1 Tax=Favolaschia claudopus TaxID=2862362 RepID=A0AAV9ZQB4_9AGAR
MDEVRYTLVLVSLTLLYVSYHLFHRMRNDELREIRGPASPSWIFGNMLQLTLTPTYGEYEFEWLKKYGAVYRFKGCFGEDRLMISDPAALHTLLSREQFALGPGMGNGGRLIYNAGCTWLTDSEKDHQRLRTALNEGFTVAAVRSYIPIFERVAQTV